MNNIFGTLIYLTMGFLVGALFSEHISMSLVDTNWDNLWVYGWVLLWPFFMTIKFLWVGVILGTISFLGWAGYMTATRGW
jgi:hypothetical protein